MPRDVLLITVECARYDYRRELELPIEAVRGVAAGHYTRPSMAGILTGQYESVVDAHAHTPTLAERLSHAGYRTAAVSYSPQTTAAFGFDAGFDEHYLLSPDSGRLSRGSQLRERLGESRLVRWANRTFRGKHATFENIPRDGIATDTALQILRRSEDDYRPLFLWVHLMGSHRPYGWGSEAIPEDVSRAADRGDASVADAVERHYRQGLAHVGKYVRTLLFAAPDDAVAVVCGDHGEELGEDGIFFHGGYRRRLVDSLINVPVFTRNVSVGSGTCLVDLPAYITDVVGVSPAASWDARTDRDHTLSIAPWNDTASVRYRADGLDLTFADAERVCLRDATPTPRTSKKQLQALGYADVG